MCSFVDRFSHPKNPLDFLCGQIYGLSGSRLGCVDVVGRPPLDLHSLYGDNAVAFSEDVYDVLSQSDPQIGIPGLSMGFANHPNFPHFLVTGDEEGVMYCRNTKLDSPKPDIIAMYEVSQNAIFAFKFVPEDPQAMIVAATGGRNLIMFDPQEGKEVAVFEGHTGSVKSLDFQKDAGNDVFASGARDGHILVWDIRVGHRKQPVSFLANAHSSKNAAPALRPQSHRKSLKVRRNLSDQLTDLQTRGCKSKRTSISPSITDVVFQDRNTFISTGTADGSIKFWDLRRISDKDPVAFHTFSLETTFTSLCLDRSRARLFASAWDKKVYMIDAGPRQTPVPLAHYSGADINSFYIRCSLSADEELLGCGSGDSKAYLFKVNEPEAAPLMLVGHRREVMGVTFNQLDPYQMATNGDDNQVLLWRAEPFLDRSNKNLIAGECELDTRVIDRTQKRHVLSATKRGRSAENTSISPWVKKNQRRTNPPPQRASTPPPPPQRPLFSPAILRTPNRSFATQPKKKKFRNMTLSPFLKQKPASRTQ